MVTIRTGELPEEDGRPIERLIIDVDGAAVCSVIIGNPMTVDCVIEKLKLLAWRLEQRKSKQI